MLTSAVFTIGYQRQFQAQQRVWRGCAYLMVADNVNKQKDKAMRKKCITNLWMLTIVSLFCISLLSCGSDDDCTAASESQRLVGKWKRVNSTSYDTFGYLDLKDGGDCIRSAEPDFKEGNHTYDYYKWVYTEESKTLRIYHEGGKTFTFQVEFTNDGGWVDMRGDEAYIYQKYY